MNIGPPYENCIKHKQPIIIYNSDPKIGAFCLFCLQQSQDSISAKQFNKQQKGFFEQAIKEIDLKKQTYQQLLDNLVTYKQNLTFSLDNIIQIINDQIKCLNEFKQYLLTSNIIQFQNAFENKKKNDKQIKEMVLKCLNDISLRFQKIDEFTTILNRKPSIGNQQYVNDGSNQELTIQGAQLEYEREQKQFQYGLINESTVNQKKYCLAFAFDKDNTIIVVGIEKVIVIYEFNHDKISKELQRLNNHKDYVWCLYFMKKSNSFVSGSMDKTIIIWSLDQHHNWVTQQTLKGHKHGIQCVWMNQMENQLISRQL